MASAARATPSRAAGESSEYPASARPICSGPGSAVRRSRAVPPGESTVMSKRSWIVAEPVMPSLASRPR